MSNKTDVSRRKFLQGASLAAGAATLAVAAGGCGTAKTVTQVETKTVEVQKPVRGRMFFTTNLQFSIVAEAAERIFPQDESGPGAKELAVAYFIDNQLAAGWGFNAREYTAGPHFKGTATQGYQGALNRRDIFMQGINALNKEANDTFKKDFPDLEDAQKDQILKKCEAGELPMDGITSAEFFGFLRGAVIAGAFADPIYNGNNNMDGWKQIDYPGAQMSYFGVINSATFQKIDPMSLADMNHEH